MALNSKIITEIFLTNKVIKPNMNNDNPIFDNIYINSYNKVHS